MDVSAFALNFLSQISASTVIGPAVVLVFAVAIYWLRVRSLRKQIRVQDAQLVKLDEEIFILQKHAEGLSQTQVIAAVEARIKSARTDLEDRRDMLSAIGNQIQAWKKRRIDIPEQIARNDAEIENLKRLNKGLLRERTQAGRELGRLQTEKVDLEDKIHRTENFIASSARKMTIPRPAPNGQNRATPGKAA